MKTLRSHTILKNTLCMVLSFAASLAVTYIFNLGKKADEDLTWMLSYGYNLLAVGVFVLGVFLLSRFVMLENKRLKYCSVIVGSILSITTVWGAYALFINNIFISCETCLLQIALMLGLNLLFIPLCKEAFELMEKFGRWCKEKWEHKVYSKRNNLLYFLIVWAVIFAAYIPLFLSQWPGNFIYDAQYQLTEVITEAYKNHHPLLHTWLMGAAYRIGLQWGNPSKGFQLYTLLQMLILTSSFAYCLLYFRKKGMPKLFRVLSFLWFALFPMNSIFSITATKDVLFAAFFLYMVIFLFRYFLDGEKFRWYTYAALVAVSALSALFRNNEIYALLIFGLVAVLLVKGIWQKGKIVIFLAAVYLLTTLSNQFLFQVLHAYESCPYRETLSVPLQGLARVASYRGSELYEFEYNEICMYINESDIANYVPFISDGIKNNANEELLKNNLPNFVKLWLKVGLEYPDEYIESFVSNTMGFWYLLPMNDYVSMNLSLYHTLIGVGEEIEKANYCNWAGEIYNYLFYENNYRFIPVLGYSFRMAPYVWLIIFIFVWSIMKKNKKSALLLVLPLAYLFTCFCGPVAALRYIYNLIVCLPLFFVLFTEKGIPCPKDIPDEGTARITENHKE